MQRLTWRLLSGLQDLRSAEGVALVDIYGPEDMHDRGGTVAFNIRRGDGRVVPYWIVEERARASGIVLRGGCFCNPGASEAAFSLPADETRRCLTALRDRPFSIQAYADCLGPAAAVGAVRMSVGLANNESDIARALRFVESVARNER